MSLLVRSPEGKVKLMIKGADTVIFERMAPNCPYLEATKAHMEEYANEGLRTLVLAYRDVPEAEFQTWYKIYQQAVTSVSNRQARLDEAAEKIEYGLLLLGATAIEDKLQDGVPDAIYNLMQAGIRLWVLTGDRQETAINIGFSCKLITSQMEMIICNESTKAATKQFLEGKLADLKSRLNISTKRTTKLQNFWRGIKSVKGKFDKDYGANVEVIF